MPRSIVGGVDEAGDGQGDFLRLASPRPLICSELDSVVDDDVQDDPLSYTILEPISIEVYNH